MSASIWRRYYEDQGRAISLILGGITKSTAAWKSYGWLIRRFASVLVKPLVGFWVTLRQEYTQQKKRVGWNVSIILPMHVRLSRHPPRAVAAGPPGQGGGTRAVHPGSARHGGPATHRPASARARRRPSPRPRWCDGGATRASRDPRRAVAGAAGDAVDPRGFNGLGERHRRQNRGEPPGQHRLARRRRAKEEDVVDRTPASSSALHPCPEFISGSMAPVLPERNQQRVMAKSPVRALWAR
jgi:hypothetical protein